MLPTIGGLGTRPRCPPGTVWAVLVSGGVSTGSPYRSPGLQEYVSVPVSRLGAGSCI